MMKEQNLRLKYSRIGQTWTGVPEIQIRELHSEIMQLKASAVQPDHTQYFAVQDMRSVMNRQEEKILALDLSDSVMINTCGLTSSCGHVGSRKQCKSDQPASTRV